MMIEFNILWIGNSIQKFFEKLIYNIVYGMYRLAYFVENIFLILVGVKPVKGNTEDNYEFLIFDIFGGHNQIGEVTRIIGIAIALGLIIFMIGFVVSITKNLGLEKGDKKIKKTLSSSFKSFMYIIIIPTAIIVILVFFTTFLRVIYETLTTVISGSNDEISATESIFRSMFQPVENDTKLYPLNPPENKGVLLTKYIHTLTFEGPNNFSYNHLYEKIGHENLAFGGSFSYLPAITTGIVLVYMFFKMAFKTGKRLMDLLIFFFIGPTVAAMIPADEGVRFDEWKKNTISCMISVLGPVIAIIMYIFFIGFTNTLLSNQSALTGFMLLVLKMLIAGGGAMALETTSNQIVSILTKTGGSEDTEADNIMAESGVMKAAKLATGGGLAGAALKGAFGSGEARKDSKAKNNLKSLIASATGSSGGSKAKGGGIKGKIGANAKEKTKASNSKASNNKNLPQQKGLKNKINSGINKTKTGMKNIGEDVKKYGVIGASAKGIYKGVSAGISKTASGIKRYRENRKNKAIEEPKKRESNISKNIRKQARHGGLRNNVSNARKNIDNRIKRLEKENSN